MTKEIYTTILQLADLVSRNSIKERFRFIQDHNLSHSQLMSMFYLDCHNEVSINELARHIGITNAAVSQLIDRLVRADLVRRVDNPLDRRGKLLELSHEGKALVKEARQTHHLWVSHLVETINAEEAERIQRGIEIILKKVPSFNLANDQPCPGEKNA